MAIAPYRIIDRRSSSGYSNNTLIQAATQTQDRKNIPNQDFDFHRNISNFGRRLLMSLGRWMFWNIPALQGSILEQANLALSSFIPQYYGRNAAWGEAAESWLENWHKICDIAGPPYDYDQYLQTLIVSPIVDGDFGTILTEGADNYPLIQIIPGHRIGGRTSLNQIVTGGPYDGARIIDGVIVNDYGRPMAYRVYGDTLSDSDFRDISTRDMFLTFIPMFPGQVRGISLLASSMFDWQDIRERRSFEMLAQKVFSSKTIVEENEAGEPMPGAGIIATAATFNDDGTRASHEYQKLDGGQYHYFKAGTNSKLTPLDWARPNMNAQAFDDSMIRDAFRGTEWDSFFSLDPKAVGGAPMRVIVEKINRVLGKRRRMAGKACVRVDGYALAKTIKRGDLPDDVDWWKWEHQGPGDVTADRKYDSDVDCQEISHGIRTRKEAIARRGHYIEDVDKQREIEVRSDLERAKKLSGEYGITIQEALILLRPPTASTNFQSPQPQQAPAEQNSGE